MKKILNYLFAALALIAAAACTKETQPEQKADQIITCSFAANEASTKTTLDGLAPRWTAGDQIKLYGYKKIGEDTFVEQGSTTVTLTAEDITSSGANCSLAIPSEWELGSTDYVYAIYPAANAISISDGGFPYVDKVYFNVPDTQDGTFANANICVGRLAMYETNLSFLNVTPILKISVPAGAFKKLEIYTGADHLSLNGDVYVSNLYGTLSTNWGGSKASTTTVNISSTATEIYVPVMCFNFLGIGASFTFTRADDTTLVLPVNNNNTMSLGNLYNLGTVLPDELPCLFSVSSTKKVRFSKGNLQATYDGSKYSWGFAASQYTYIGNVAGSTTIDSQTNNAVVDLFGWSTDATYYGINTSVSAETYSGSFKDWGTAIDNKGTWRTLTNDEWRYLLSATSDDPPGRGTGAKYFKYGVKVCGAENCLVIAPDGFSDSIASSYDESSWATAEAAGLVCLPKAGHRSKSSVSKAGTNGYYWASSSKSEFYAYRMGFYAGIVAPSVQDNRSFGFSVRLVTDVN